MLRAHAMKHWSSTQASAAPGSGEAEFYGVVRGFFPGLRILGPSAGSGGFAAGLGLDRLKRGDRHLQPTGPRET